MSGPLSTALRYKPDHGPVVFGTPAFDVRWNRITQTVIVETRDGAAWSETGEMGQLVLLALAAAHRQGRMEAALHDMLRGAQAAIAITSNFYRCGRLMCWRPTWQEATR